LKSQNPQQILICLQIVEKLFKTNPETYTVPLMREGVVHFIKELSTEEGFEKILSTKFAAPVPTEKDPLDQAVSEESELIKQILMEEKAFTEHLEQEGKDFLERHRLLKEAIQHKEMVKLLKEKQLQREQLQTEPPLGKPKQEINAAILQLAKQQSEAFFENSDFMGKIKETAKEEFGVLEKLNSLAQRMIEEAAQNIPKPAICS